MPKSRPNRHYTHLDTPKRIRIKQFVNREGHSRRKAAIEFSISQSTVRRVLAGSDRRHGHDIDTQERRGRKPKVSAAHLQAMEDTIIGNGYDGHRLTYESFPSAANCDISLSRPTIRKYLRKKDIAARKACKKELVDESTAAKRVEFA